MRPRKGRFKVVPYVGNKLFPSFGKNKILKILFFENIFIFRINIFLFLKKLLNLKKNKKFDDVAIFLQRQ